MPTNENARRGGNPGERKYLNQNPKSSAASSIDIATVARAALEQSERILATWLPDGKRQGAEWLARNPTRDDANPGSFSVNLLTGKWSDFATDTDKGGDLVALVAFLDNLSQPEAARRLADFLGMDGGQAPDRRPHRAAPGQPTQAPKPAAPLAPIPEAALAVRPLVHPRHGQPTATWTYRDEAGRPLFFQCRFDPPQGRKGYAPQTWSADGWRWQAPPSPRPPYGLDRLAAAPATPVLVCEGEKAADAAQGLFPNHVIIASLNGAQSPQRTDWRPIQGRRVYLWPDADAPGKLYAATVAQLALEAGAATVAILDLGSIALDPATGETRDLPAGYDAADALAAGWTAATLAQSAIWVSHPDAESTNPGAPSGEDVEWPPPQAIVSKFEVAPYPSDALPPGLRAAVDEVVSFVQAPYAMCAASALAALAMAGQGLLDVRRAPRLVGPVSLFILVIGTSGERKTAVDAAFQRPLRAWELEQRQTLAGALRDHKAELAAWNAELAGIQDAIRAAAKSAKPTGELKAYLKTLQGQEPPAPLVPRLIYSDVTSEALAYRLATGWPSGAVSSDEGGAVLGGHSLKADNQVGAMALLNNLWSGTDFTVDRKTGPSFAVANVRASVNLMVQSEVLQDFHERSGRLASGSGLYARFLVCHPESTIGTRPYREPPATWPAVGAYERRILDLLALDLPRDAAGQLKPTMLDLDPEAKSAWVEFFDGIEGELGAGGQLRQVKDVAAKIADQAARVAALFHLYEQGPTGTIGAAAMAGAIRIVGWHLLEARRFFGELALPQEIGDALRLDTWLRAEAKAGAGLTIPRRLAQQMGPVRDGTRLDAAITELRNLDRINVVKVGRRVNLVLNPYLEGL
ncbi:MAG: DUF3987 domain-containing protein [Chromatiaceae bacterium]|nr:DUF3987 domain-containing protein [Chromatiaceae bacterium]